MAALTATRSARAAAPTPPRALSTGTKSATVVAGSGCSMNSCASHDTCCCGGLAAAWATLGGEGDAWEWIYGRQHARARPSQRRKGSRHRRCCFRPARCLPARGWRRGTPARPTPAPRGCASGPRCSAPRGGRGTLRPRRRPRGEAWLAGEGLGRSVCVCVDCVCGLVQRVSSISIRFDRSRRAGKAWRLLLETRRKVTCMTVRPYPASGRAHFNHKIIKGKSVSLGLDTRLHICCCVVASFFSTFSSSD